MTTAAGPSWSGPAVRPASVRPVVVAALTMLLVVAGLLPLDSRAAHVAVVLGGLVPTLALAVLPRPAPRPEWTIDTAGITHEDPDGTVHRIAAAEYDALAFAPDPATRVDRLLLVRTTEPPAVVQSVRLDGVATPFTACVVARHLGLGLLLPPAGEQAVDQDCQRLWAALGAPAPVSPNPTPTPGESGSGSETLTDRSAASTACAVTVRLVLGLLGLLLVAGLSTSAGETASGRVGAALGVLLAVVALPALARGRLVRASRWWQVGAAGIEVDDRERGRLRVDRARLGAVVLTGSGRGGHGASLATSALVVDPEGAPVVEFPLGWSVKPAEFAAFLRRHGIRVVATGVRPWDVHGGFSPSG